jgi:hypothetical protein
MSEAKVKPLEVFYKIKPEHVWLRIGNCETPGRFQIILELNGGDRNGGTDVVLYDYINECDGNISQMNNLSWLVNRKGFE